MCVDSEVEPVKLFYKVMLAFDLLSFSLHVDTTGSMSCSLELSEGLPSDFASISL